MPTGSSHRLRPAQDAPRQRLDIDRSYFRVEIHSAQIVAEAGQAVLSSTVSSSLPNTSLTKSVHLVAAVQKDSPCRGGAGSLLTDWLPARSGSSLKIEVECQIVRDAPFQVLAKKMGEMKLAAALSTINPALGLTAQITALTGHVLSYLREEGKSEQLVLPLSLPIDIIQPGYYAVVGSFSEQLFPGEKDLKIDGGRLTNIAGKDVTNLCYVIVEVLVCPSYRENIPATDWGQLLATNKEKTRYALHHTAEREKRLQILEEWLEMLREARAACSREQRFIKCDLDFAIADAQAAVSFDLAGNYELDPDGSKVYPLEWQTVLGVRSDKELKERIFSS